MVLIANRAVCFGREYNVTSPAGFKNMRAYDAAVYAEMGRPERGVLEITVICSLEFADGVDAKGKPLRWAASDKRVFMQVYRDTIVDVWAEKWRITTRGGAAVKDVGVIFDIRVAEAMGVMAHSHWNVRVTAVDAWSSSTTEPDGGWVRNGGVNLDSLDCRPENKGGSMTQRSAAHEFGHMLGIRDEYKAAPDPNTAWLADIDSLMNQGELVRDRHYAIFADFLDRQFEGAARLGGSPIKWKVDGRIDLFNANL